MEGLKQTFQRCKAQNRVCPANTFYRDDKLIL